MQKLDAFCTDRCEPFSSDLEEFPRKVEATQPVKAHFMQREEVTPGPTPQIEERLLPRGSDQIDDRLHICPCLDIVAMRIEVEIFLAEAPHIPGNHAIPCSFL